MKIREYPQSTFTKLKHTDRIFLQEINDGCVLVKREGTFYKHKLPDTAMDMLLMILNGDLFYTRRGERVAYDPE